jgi:hypothetical protein
MKKVQEQELLEKDDFVKLREQDKERMIKTAADFVTKALEKDLNGDKYTYTVKDGIYTWSLIKQKKNEAGDVINTPTEVLLSLYNTDGLKVTCHAKIKYDGKDPLGESSKMCGIAMIKQSGSYYIKGDLRIGLQSIETRHFNEEMAYDILQHVPELVSSVGLTAGMFNNQ